MHWKVDSQPKDHQGSPKYVSLKLHFYVCKKYVDGKKIWETEVK